MIPSPSGIGLRLPTWVYACYLTRVRHRDLAGTNGYFGKRFMELHTHRLGMGWFLEFGEYGEQGWLGGTSFGLANSALHAEMNACLAGLQRAVRRSLHVVTLYTDSTSMVQCLRDLRVSDISIIRTVARIRRISNNFDWCSIHKVDRGSVERAHGLVTTANISLSSFNFFLLVFCCFVCSA